MIHVTGPREAALTADAGGTDIGVVRAVPRSCQSWKLLSSPTLPPAPDATTLPASQPPVLPRRRFHSFSTKMAKALPRPERPAPLSFPRLPGQRSKAGPFCPGCSWESPSSSRQSPGSLEEPAPGREPGRGAVGLRTAARHSQEPTRASASKTQSWLKKNLKK